MAESSFDQAAEQNHLALAEFVKGDPEPLKMMYSHRDDVSIANPFGPPARGWEQAAATMERAAMLYRDGEVVDFETVATNVTPELAYIVEVERYRAKVGGREEVVPVALRVTSIFRPEEGPGGSCTAMQTRSRRLGHPNRSYSRRWRELRKGEIRELKMPRSFYAVSASGWRVAWWPRCPSVRSCRTTARREAHHAKFGSPYPS
ncbi:MAG TPA: hypothetical protein VEM93_04970 [Actinomycetota bacterium]|nr:hypothetical protein [Actinomycetota bacterium]